MSISQDRRRSFVTLAVVGLALFVGWRVWGPASPPPGITLTNLQSVDQLATRFNADAGSTRLVLILSPT
jgi:hypothetical protein